MCFGKERMTPSAAHSGRHMLDGTVRVFLADALFPLTGVLTAAFLTRRLGPHGYGLFVLAATLIGWIEWSIASLFSRATIKCVGETEDWQSVGTAVLQLHLVVGGGVAMILWALVPRIAGMLNEPQLTSSLQLFVFDILLFNLAHAQRSILVGIGRFRERAWASAGRALGKVLLIVTLVGCGFSVSGAIVGSMGASLTELVIGRYYLRLPLLQRSSFPLRRLWGYALPLSLSALSVAFYNRMDLLAVKMLGGTAEQAGFYGAAQNVSWLPGIFAASFAPLLLSTLGRALRAGDLAFAKRVSRDAMRAVLLCLPFIALAAGTAGEIIGLIFHPAFLPAAPLVSLLLFASLALMMLSVTTAIVTAADKPSWTLALTGPLVPLGLIGHWLLIPRLGPLGASLVTTLVASVGALASVLAVYTLWRILPPARTLWRSVLLCGCAYALAVVWPTAGLFLFVKLVVLGLAILCAFIMLGEFDAGELALVRSLLQPGTLAEHAETTEHLQKDESPRDETQVRHHG